MKPKQRWKLLGLGIFGAILIGGPAWATNVYVSMPGTVIPQSPYTSWLIAATNIQVAIDAIVTNGGNIVYVSNGVYYLTNQLVITKGIELRSWNQGVLDQTNTVLHGNNFVGKPVTNRCVYMAHPQALVAGFTITQGKVTNVSADIYAIFGAGVFMTNGGSVADCIVTGNMAGYPATGGSGSGGGGGGVCTVNSTGTIERCVISKNLAKQGAGIAVYSGSNTVRNCTLSFNTARGSWGGGAHISGAGNEIVDCISYSNYNTQNASGGGAGFVLDVAARARNCLVFGNTASDNGGGIMLRSTAGRMENCTVTSNTCYGADNGGGVYCVNATAWIIANSIIYGNTTTTGGNTNNDFSALNRVTLVISNCCSTVDFNALRPGINTGNITTPPQFMNRVTYDFRLDRSSPCINKGVNWDWMYDATDLQGYRRILEGIVDMGAYESMPPSGTIFGGH